MPAITSHQANHSISFRGVSKHFGDVVALDNLTFNITAKQTTAIVGPSGCGKSTLLQLVNGLQHPDTGEVVIDDINLSQQAIQSLRRRMGYCVQHIGLFPHLSIKHNIVLLAKLESWEHEQIEQRLQHLLQLTALDEGMLNRYPHQLSGGQQQRAGLCRALMLRPDFLLLDEPFAAVDPITRIDIHEQYQQLQAKEPRTTLLVTHDIQEALSLAATIIVMYRGKIIAQFQQSELDALPSPEDTILQAIRHGLA